MKIWAIIKKEMQAYFFSPTAYIVFASYFLIIGYLFWVVLVSSKQANIEPLLYNTAFVLLLASPVLTMRLISEERKSNTIELLLTSPISPVEIIIGKFLACFLLYMILIFGSFQYPAILYTYSNQLDWGAIVSGYTGIILLGAAYIAFGLFASTLTENQVISAMITFGGLLIFWIIGWAKYVFENVAGEIMSRLSLMERFTEFLKGIFDTGNVVYFLIFTLIWLFIATRVLESDRWR